MESQSKRVKSQKKKNPLNLRKKNCVTQKKKKVVLLRIKIYSITRKCSSQLTSLVL